MYIYHEGPDPPLGAGPGDAYERKAHMNRCIYIYIYMFKYTNNNNNYYYY